MRNQEQILLLRKQTFFFKCPSEASRLGFIGHLFALSCSNSVSVLEHFVFAFVWGLLTMLLRTLRNDPRATLKDALDSEINSYLPLSGTTPRSRAGEDETCLFQFPAEGISFKKSNSINN